MEQQSDRALADLSDPERRWVEATRTGVELDLGGKKHSGDRVPEKTMRAWGPAHQIRARVIRDILLGRLGADLDPHGIRLRGARIIGRLDLDYVTAAIPLSLTSCLLTDGAALSAASLPAVVMRDSCLEHPDLPALVADRITTSLLDLSRATVTAHCESGAIQLEGAEIGQLTADGATLVNEWGPALDARECHVRRDVGLTRFEDESGAQRQFKAEGRGDRGTICLWGAQIDGALWCSGKVTNGSGPALDTTAATIGQSVLAVTMECDGDGSGGAIRFRSTRIGGSLMLSYGTVTNSTGPAMIADGLSVGQDVSFNELTASGWGDNGVISLTGARVSGGISWTAAKITNVNWSGGSGGGPAVRAEDLVVGEDLAFRGGFTATGGGDNGVIHLTGARISGQLTFLDATVSCDTGPAVLADGLNVGQDLYLLRLTATGAGENGVLDLSNVQVSHNLAYRPTELTNTTHPASLLNADGLTYGGLPVGVTPGEWLAIIRHSTPRYAAQPYQYLAAALTAAGDDDGARDVLIAQRQDQLDRKVLTGARTRAWVRFTGVTLGYGYRPVRALLFLLAVVTASVIISVVLGGHGALAQTTPAGALVPAAPCTALQRVAVGLDLGAPIITATPHCDATAATTGNIFTIARWFLQVAVWALATLFVAGFTSAVRRT